MAAGATCACYGPGPGLQAAPRRPAGAAAAGVAAGAPARPVPQRQQRQRLALPCAALADMRMEAASFVMPEDVLLRAIKGAFEDTFWGPLAAPRVLASLLRLQTEEELVKDWPGLGKQEANSYLEGLTAVPFPDPYGGAYPWLQALEPQTPVILKEFLEVTADPELERKGNNIWVPAVRGDAAGYGDDWRTLVLQDRGYWDPDNEKLFPNTVRIMRELQAPTLEVFFARQPAGTGIASHTDYVNFVQTTHLGLIVPQGDCWMKVGEHVRNWAEGKVMICDTSFYHQTFNNTSSERIVLIMRHWHPEVTPVERIAIQFLFDCLDARTAPGIADAQRRAADALAGSAAGRAAALVSGAGKGRKKAKGAAGGGAKKSGGGGFGAAAPAKGFGKK